MTPGQTKLVKNTPPFEEGTGATGRDFLLGGGSGFRSGTSPLDYGDVVRTGALPLRGLGLAPRSRAARWKLPRWRLGWPANVSQASASAWEALSLAVIYRSFAHASDRVRARNPIQARITLRKWTTRSPEAAGQRPRKAVSGPTSRATALRPQRDGDPLGRGGDLSWLRGDNRLWRKDCDDGYTLG